MRGDPVLCRTTLIFIAAVLFFIGIIIYFFAPMASETVNALGTMLMAIVTAALGGIAYIQLHTTRAQLRAYVHVDAEFRFLPAPYPPNILLRVKNFGLTPAKEITLQHRIGIDLSGKKIFDDNLSPISGVRDLAPQQSSMHTIVLGSKMWVIERATIKYRAYNLFIYGMVKYGDTFNNKRITRFRFQLLLDDDGIEKATFIAPSSGGNRTT